MFEGVEKIRQAIIQDFALFYNVDPS